MTKGSATKLFLAAVFAITAGCGPAPDADAPAEAEASALLHGAPRARIVLVHGAFADASGWRQVIPLLEGLGYPVVAVQNPLTSLADDVATTKRVVDAETKLGPVVLVGHSFGGVVITAAGADNPQVKALVYINAFAPEVAEPLGALAGKFGPGPLNDALVPDSAGFLFIDRAKFHDVFCADVGRIEARIMAATQKPLQAGVFAQAVDRAAWKTIPSWYLVGQQDQAISPELQRFMAKRIGAKVTEIASSHVSFISHPFTVVRMIVQAANATTR